MSDTFDHEGMAWESILNEWDSPNGEDDTTIGELSYGGAKGDPNYYHSWQTIHGIVRESEKAYLIDPLPLIDDGRFRIWLAKSLVRYIAPDRKKIFVHLPTFNTLLKNRIMEIRCDDFEDLDATVKPNR